MLVQKDEQRKEGRMGWFGLGRFHKFGRDCSEEGEAGEEGARTFYKRIHSTMFLRFSDNFSRGRRTSPERAGVERVGLLTKFRRFLSVCFCCAASSGAKRISLSVYIMCFDLIFYDTI